MAGLKASHPIRDDRDISILRACLSLRDGECMLLESGWTELNHAHRADPSLEDV